MNTLGWIIALILSFIITYIYFYVKQRKAKTKYDDKIYRLQQNSAIQAVYRALSAMDKTNKNYVDEDQANRELTSCLTVTGHAAVYHKSFNGTRTVDIFVDNCIIIEGKLDPIQSDIDRLVGQVADYSILPYHICIVIYGNISEDSIRRLKLLYLDNKGDKASLIYLPQANRIRKEII